MSRDELHEVDVQIRGNETEAQQGHQISMKDRDPTAMNDHVKVKMYIICYYIAKAYLVSRILVALHHENYFPEKVAENQTKATITTSTMYTLTFERWTHICRNLNGIRCYSYDAYIRLRSLVKFQRVK